MSESVVVPEKPMFNGFPKWRKYQRQAVGKLLRTNKKFLILDAPTGSGKSLIGMSVAQLSLSGGRTYYLVGTKDLQDQVLRDFSFVALLKGRNNFSCLIKDVPCDQCMYSYVKKLCPKKERCPYYAHKEVAKQSKFVIWNYPMFLVNQTFAGDFPPADLLICDEAHLLESALMNFVNIKFDHHFFNDLSLGFPGKDEEKYVFDRINKAEKIINKQYSTIAGQMQMKLYEDEEPDRVELKLCQELESKVKKLKFFRAVYDEDTWVMDYYRNQYDWENDYISFKPLKVDKFSDYIFGWADKILLVSATMPHTSVICNSLGINRNEIARLNIPSTFKRENRPVIFHPIGRMSYPYWEQTIEKIVKYCYHFLSNMLC